MQNPIPKHTSGKVPLFWKFTVGLTIMVVLFGTINIVLINRIVYTSLDEELQQRGLSIEVINRDNRRAKGIHANAVMGVDPHLKNTCLSDIVGGSAVFYDSWVRLEKI